MGDPYALVLPWRSGDIFHRSQFSSGLLPCPGDSTQAVRLVYKCPWPLNYPAGTSSFPSPPRNTLALFCSARDKTQGLPLPGKCSTPKLRRFL